MNNRHFQLLALMSLSIFLFQGRADAHAFLDRSEPRVGSVVDKAPTAVTIWFTQQPEHAFSRIDVYDSEGKQVDNSNTRTDPNDPKALTVTLIPLKPGTYRVVWHVLSVDTHRTQGEFKFTVK